MISPEQLGVCEILHAVDDGLLTDTEVLNAATNALKIKRAEISALISRAESMCGPELPIIASLTDFHLLDEQFGNVAVTRAWNSVVRYSLRNPTGALAGVVVDSKSRVSIEDIRIDLGVFASYRSTDFSECPCNYGTRADEVFRAAVQQAGQAIDEWPELRKY